MPSKQQDIQEKIRQNCIEKYGVDHPNKKPEIKNKAIQTCLEKYGCVSPSQVPEFANKKIQTSLKRIGKPHHFCKEQHEKGDRSEYYRKYKGSSITSLASR